jgi:quercetin dioxygenase-like cupin family protein|tara:strand:- start:97931 stop:98296 length:366 start_codon:yes stop_codon:yes gene_type:complete
MKYILNLMIVGLLFSSCGNTNNSVNPTEKNLASKVAYADEINKVVVFESHYKMLVFALKKGQDLKPHSATMDAPLIMLEGSAMVTIGTTETTVKKGDIITLPKDSMHGVSPITNCKFLLIK